jgi:hypothetical protein
MRVTKSMLQSQCNTINNLKGTPLEYSSRINSQFKSNIGNYHLYQAYGSIALHQTMNEGGGIKEIFSLTTKKDLFYQLQAFIRGLIDSREVV